MIIPDKRKITSVLLTKLKPGGEMQSAPMEPEKTVGADSELHGIAEDMLMAQKNGSAQDLVTALKALKAIFCMDEDSEDSQEG